MSDVGNRDGATGNRGPEPRPAIRCDQLGDYFAEHPMAPLIWARDEDGRPKPPHRGTIWRWRRHGVRVARRDGPEVVKLRDGFRVGRYTFFTAAAIDRFLRALAVRAATPRPAPQLTRTEAGTGDDIGL